MSKYYKAEDIVSFLNRYCPKDMWEYQIADLPTIEVSEDCISREHLSDKVGRYYAERGDFGSFECFWILDAIKDAPSVIPSRADGEWICNTSEVAGEGYYICSNCKRDEYNATDFCPNCGAKMKGADDD